MASATARRRDPTDDDIAAIAKQISDQAEAIYQKWKSRGLVPADLIACHAAADATEIGSMLKPQSPVKPAIDTLLTQSPPSLVDNNRLEKFVKSFVVNDKARLAARNNNHSHANKTIPSSIQYALQKFEKNCQSAEISKTTTSCIHNNNSKVNGYLSNGHVNGGSSSSSSLASNSNVTVNNHQQMTATLTPNKLQNGCGKPLIGEKPQLYPKPRCFSTSDTIEVAFPVEENVIVKSPADNNYATLNDHLEVNGNGLQTWPLKNRQISTECVKKSVRGVHVNSDEQQQNRPTTILNYSTVPGRVNGNLHSQNCLQSTIEDVALEETRLINALKNGDVVNDDEALSSVTATIPTATVVNPNIIKNNAVISEQPLEHNINCKDDNSVDAFSASGTLASTKWSLKHVGRKIDSQQQQLQPVPHPELTSTQRQHLRMNASNPVRPFLTRGSVAERVLIFERCPSEILLDKRTRTSSSAATHSPQFGQKLQPASPTIPNKSRPLPHTTLQRHVRTHRNVNIPRFYFPMGKPGPPGQQEALKTKISAAFKALNVDCATTPEHFSQLTIACQLPLYWKSVLYLAVTAEKGSCTLEQFLTFWTGMTSTCHDAASCFIYILTRGRGRTWLLPKDFIPLIQDVVETHPGLTFLKEATEFHMRYVHTVIARIYYAVNRSWSGRITIAELRRSNLLQTIQLLEEEEDINQITQYFSYEHFYVIYCKFWELDRDHDLVIDKQDLTRHNDHALSLRIIDRIFSGCVTRGQIRSQHDEKMSYTEFVWFLLSEEDKHHPTAIEYWFRCMDLDGDGFLSMYELEYFYEEQMQRMDAIGIETLPFHDCLCQMLDMVKPAVSGRISLRDLKVCRMTPILFDTFFNLEKYLDHEQRDPFATQRDHDLDGQEMSDWDRYAAEEYELLVAEEGSNEQQDSLEYECGYDRLIR